MTKIYNSIASIVTAFIRSLSSAITIAENAFGTQFAIKPIKKENLGILNSLILGSGLISIALMFYNYNPTNPIVVSIDVAVLSILFLVSIWVSNNHYIHTLIALLASISLFQWLFILSYNWSSIVYFLALVILFLFVTYFDLLKKNIVLQLTNVLLLFLMFNVNNDKKLSLVNFFQSDTLNLDILFNQESISNILPYILIQSLMLPILYIAIQVARRTNRIAFAKIMNPVFHVLMIAAVIAVVLLVPPILAPIVLLMILVAALIMALKNHYNLGFAYVLVFLVTSLILIINNYNMGTSLPYKIVMIIFPLITILAIIGKSNIDKGQPV